jgi:hypothetical protein
MKIFRAFSAAIVFGMFMASYAAHADPVPDYVLQKDYENCMGGQTSQQDVQRAQYCSCMRNSMRSWDEEAYANLLLEQAKTQVISPVIEALAKNCMEKVIH